MGKRSDYKKIGEFGAWDLDKGCRGVVNQQSAGRRDLKKRLRRQERARLKSDSEKEMKDEEITELIKQIARDEYGMEVTIKESPDGETFESLFGISLDEVKRLAELQETEDDI